MPTVICEKDPPKPANNPAGASAKAEAGKPACAKPAGKTSGAKADKTPEGKTVPVTDAPAASSNLNLVDMTDEQMQRTILNREQAYEIRNNKIFEPFSGKIAPDVASLCTLPSASKKNPTTTAPSAKKAAEVASVSNRDDTNESPPPGYPAMLIRVVGGTMNEGNLAALPGCPMGHRSEDTSRCDSDCSAGLDSTAQWKRDVMKQMMAGVDDLTEEDGWTEAEKQTKIKEEQMLGSIKANIDAGTISQEKEEKVVRIKTESTSRCETSTRAETAVRVKTEAAVTIKTDPEGKVKQVTTSHKKKQTTITDCQPFYEMKVKGCVNLIDLTRATHGSTIKMEVTNEVEEIVDLTYSASSDENNTVAVVSPDKIRKHTCSSNCKRRTSKTHDDFTCRVARGLFQEEDADASKPKHKVKREESLDDDVDESQEPTNKRQEL